MIDLRESGKREKDHRDELTSVLQGWQSPQDPTVRIDKKRKVRRNV